MTKKGIRISQGDWGSSEGFWQGRVEGKALGTDITVLFYATDEIGKGLFGTFIPMMKCLLSGRDEHFSQLGKTRS